MVWNPMGTPSTVNQVYGKSWNLQLSLGQQCFKGHLITYSQ